jgi:heme-degrading monooxygenase HmoA
MGMLDQGAPEIVGSPRDQEWIAPAFGLKKTDLHPELPLEVISTGLRYLIVPVIAGALERARIVRDIGFQLRTVDAQFAVLLDESAIEVRHWNNDGVVEDIATGSAAGTIGAYRGHLLDTGVRDYQRVSGCLEIKILRRDAEGWAHFLLFSVWESWDAIRAYAGDAPETAVLYLDDERFGLVPDLTTSHYEVGYSTSCLTQGDSRT